MVEDLEREEDVMEVFMVVEMGESEVVEVVVIEAVEVVVPCVRLVSRPEERSVKLFYPHEYFS